MQFIKKALFIALISLAVTACSHTTSTPSASPKAANTSGGNAIDAKKGDTTKTGVLSKTGTTYYLTPAGESPQAVESYSVDLSTWVGKTVKVTGQYSGNTLFIGKIE